MKRILACLIGLFFAMPSWAALPEGYTELEYIESTGTQYIDTGVTPNVDAKNTIYEYGSVFERTSGTTDAAVGGIRNASAGSQTFKFPNTLPAAIENQTVYGQPTSFKQVSTGKHIYKVIAKDRSQTYTLDENVIVDSGSAPSNVTFNNETITVFAFKLSTGVVQWYFVGKIYSIYYKENEQYKFNFIPAKRTSDSAIGMYDTVSGQFFTNAGTGEFIAGPEVIIKIATTKMVDEEFAAAEAKLATTVQTIESVVSRTITQTGQIATLQAEKQTRPDETCPAGKKCLLVQDEDGTPHWYEIIEP